MSDRRLRELERCWRETRDPSAEAAYLLLRVRMGELSRDGLEWAAFCGHEGARWAVCAPVVPEYEWLARVDRLQGRRRVVAHAACARLVHRAVGEHLPGDRRPLSLLEAVEAWLQRPDARATRRIGELLDELADFQARVERHVRGKFGGYGEWNGIPAVVLCFLVIEEAARSVARVRSSRAEPAPDLGLLTALDEGLRVANWDRVARKVPDAIRRSLLRLEPGLERL